VNTWERFERALQGRRVWIRRREQDWLLNFGDGNFIVVEAVWRLSDGQKILLTDTDDGHQFGLPAPVNAEAQANELLSGGMVTSVNANNVTADLDIQFSHGIRLEVLTNSTGYESWQGYSNGELVEVGVNGWRL
jgi:hypothetical protein